MNSLEIHSLPKRGEAFQAPEVKPAPNKTDSNERLKLLYKSTANLRYAEGALISEASKMKFCHLKGFALLNAGTAMYAIIRAIADYRNSTTRDKIDNSLYIATEVGHLHDATYTFTYFLEYLGAIGKVGKWMGPFEVFFIVFEFIGLVLSSKKLVETHILFNKLDACGAANNQNNNMSLEDYRKAMKAILDERYASKSFIKEGLHSDEPSIAHRLMVIEANAAQKIKSYDNSEIAEGKRALKNTFKALKERIDDKKWTHRWEALAALITVIACVMFVFFPPTLPVSLGMLVVATVIGLAAEYIQKRRAEEQFRKAIFNQA